MKFRDQEASPERPRTLSVRGQQREQEILNAAADVFSRKGYAAASVEDVATMVGMLKGSLYHYFDSKEDLLYRLTKSIHLDAFETFERSQQVGGTALDRIDSLVREHIQTLAGDVTKTRVFYTEFAHLQGQRYQEIVGLRRRYEALVQGLIEEGQREGLVCRRRDPHVMMLATLTLLNSIQMWYRTDGRYSAELLADQYAALVSNGLRCGEDRATCTCGSSALPKGSRRRPAGGTASAKRRSTASKSKASKAT